MGAENRLRVAVLRSPRVSEVVLFRGTAYYELRV
jgi:hypothetical protein